MKILLIVIFCGLVSGCTANPKPSAKIGQGSSRIESEQDIPASRKVPTQGVFCGDKDIDDNF